MKRTETFCWRKKERRQSAPAAVSAWQEHTCLGTLVSHHATRGPMLNIATTLVGERRLRSLARLIHHCHEFVHCVFEYLATFFLWVSLVLLCRAMLRAETSHPHSHTFFDCRKPIRLSLFSMKYSCGVLPATYLLTHSRCLMYCPSSRRRSLVESNSPLHNSDMACGAESTSNEVV